MTTAASARPRVFAVWFKDLDRWDVKFFGSDFLSCYPVKRLAPYIHAHNEKVYLANFPEQVFRILGVNNVGGIFHAYDAIGKEFNQPYKKVDSFDFAYNPYRVNVGSIGIVPPELSGNYISPAYVVFATDPTTLDPQYLQLVLKSDWYNQKLRAATAGSVRQNLTFSLLGTLEIPLPPLSVQQAIVDRWQQAQAEIAAAQLEAEEIERSAEKEFLHGLGLCAPNRGNCLKYYVLQWHDLDRWGVDVNRPAQSLDVSTSCFPVHTLGELIADLENGWSPQCLPRPAMPEEWGVLKLGAVSFGIFNQEENKALPERLQPIPRYEVRPGDLLISRANIARYVGACALVKETRPHLMLCDKIFRVAWKNSSPILPGYLDEVMKIPQLRHQIENALTGSSPTMKNISKPALLALRMPLPPRDEQQRLIDLIAKQRLETAAIRAQSAERHNSIKAEIEAMILGTNCRWEKK